MTFKAVALTFAAASGDIRPIFPLHTDPKLLTPHVEYYAGLVTDTFLLSYSKALTAVFTVNTTRDLCSDHKMYV